MLDVITDFWKPSTRKGQAEDKPVVFDDLQVGATIGFGFVPQAAISGRRMAVTGVNTYQFDDEKLTSFVITPEKEAQISLIVAESEGEKYLALSRRISMADRLRLFDERAFNDILTMPERKELACKDGGDGLKGWLVGNYTKQIHAFSGSISKGDHRKEALKETKKFDYYLLVSSNNEYAIEIEKYPDNRVELFATVYRRVTDIGQITPPEAKPEKVVSFDKRKEEPKVEAQPVEEVKAPEPRVEVKAEPKVEAKPETKENQTETEAESKSPVNSLPPAPKMEPKFLSEENEAPLATSRPEPKLFSPTEPKPEQKPEVPVAALKAETQSSGIFKPSGSVTPDTQKQQPKPEQKPMSLSQSENVTKLESVNGGKSEFKPANEAFGRAGQAAQSNDSIECELKVANKIIDEAIRSEMRLSDIVRRVVELPVANQESVQLPITLSDEDYMLLSIRYGIPASDKNAIRRRIVDELNDFSGSKKKSD